MDKYPGKSVDPNFIDDVHCPNLFATSEIQAQVKQFNIEHGERDGHRLVHSSIEGPENAVYARGHSTVWDVKLPDFWRWLVDKDSITVHITSTCPNNYFVARTTVEGFVTSPTGGDYSRCSFNWIAYAKRQDLPDLVVERPMNEKEKAHLERMELDKLG